MDLILTDANFDEEIKKASMPVLVEFSAEWCGPCKMMAPILEEIAKEFEGKLLIGKLDVDANQNSAMKFQTMSIPTLIFFKNGAEVRRLIGYQDRATLVKTINEILTG